MENEKLDESTTTPFHVTDGIYIHPKNKNTVTHKDKNGNTIIKYSIGNGRGKSIQLPHDMKSKEKFPEKEDINDTHPIINLIKDRENIKNEGIDEMNDEKEELLGEAFDTEHLQKASRHDNGRYFAQNPSMKVSNKNYKHFALGINESLNEGKWQDEAIEHIKKHGFKIV